jgi:hypothetical protein
MKTVTKNCNLNNMGYTFLKSIFSQLVTKLHLFHRGKLGDRKREPPQPLTHKKSPKKGALKNTAIGGFQDSTR